MHKLLRSILITYLAFNSGPSLAISAQEMLSACRPIANADVTGEYVRFPQTFQTGMCWGTFSAIQETIVHSFDGKTLAYQVCAPSNSTLAQLVSIYVKYAENHPEILHKESYSVALDSLRKAFPCDE